MKRLTFAFLFILGSIPRVDAQDSENLYPSGDMEEITQENSVKVPKGWHAKGAISFEADEGEYQSGKSSMKIQTPEGQSFVITSQSISVEPNAEYEIEASALARGKRRTQRPFFGIRLIGNNQQKYPSDNPNGYLVKWVPDEAEIGFATKKARFVAASDAKWIRIYLTVRANPEGVINVDNVILRKIN